MGISKRDLLKTAVGMTVYAGASASSHAANATYKRIACEEAFMTTEVLAELRRRAGDVFSMKNGVTQGPFLPKLLDIGAGRIQGMDADGVDVQILSLVSRGVQIFETAAALSLAKLTNDQLAEAIGKYPARYAGLATVAPQAPAATAKELERAVHTLGLKGGIINSHTHNEYLDDKKFWPIFEAAQALDVPIYLHPREPSAGMEKPLSIPGYTIGWGYAVETGTHALRLINGGVFEQFPKLRIVLGHLGETLPFLLDRIDNRYRFEMNTFRRPLMKRLPSEYFRENFVITTSGMNYTAPLAAAVAAMGSDKVLFAADYPLELQKDAVQGLEAAGFGADVKKNIFESNPARVFKL